MRAEEAIAWCRQRYRVPGHPLALTLPYADPARQDSLLALNAVISEVASVPGQVSEPDVARRKLQWWQIGLAEGEAHPAILAWQATGAAERVPAEAFAGLIDGVALEIEPPRFEQVDELVAHAREVAGPAALLEARLLGWEQGLEQEQKQELVKMAGAMYRVRLVRDLVLDARQDRWLVPLQLQAEYQLTRQQVADGESPLRLAALVRHLAGEALLEHDRAARGLPPPAAWHHRHLLLRLHLDRLLGTRLLRRPGRIARQRISATGLPAAMSVWRRARKLRRAARNSGYFP